MIKSICSQNTNLNEKEVEKIIEVSKSIDLMADFYESDVFIDVLSKYKDEAYVVSHGKPKNKSLYKENVVGKKALYENEPGVIKTLKIGVTTRDIKALTQEDILVKQTIQPITLEDKVIGVLIVEKDISDELQDKFQINKNNNKKEEIENKNSKEFVNLIKNNNFLTDDLNSAILIFDKNGYLKIKNKNAETIYEKIGFELNLENIHYNDIQLENIKFENIIKDEIYNKKSEINIANNYYKVNTKHIKDDEFKVVRIIEDISELKQKEAELILKSVAVREAHHRVKNNLHTVISMIRKQSRLSNNEEVKHCLDNITNRVFAILSTHHLLSKEVDNNISILDAINLLVSNIQGSYCDNKDIDIYTTGNDFKISAEKATALLLALNEIIQNCYDHAFKGRENGSIKILLNQENGYRNIAIIDDGVGIDENNIDKKSLGNFIIDSYITQVLRGNIERTSDKNGTKILLKIPS